uniref:Ig-like domain-containing protein n=1 Tax=Branchiostoma floridae TaxID=7739 RepID=C3YDZ4_BRAFL|eukprot:XP_002605603.1 hypothetical protein BRAFLDRAFT_94301 [Branchiostoma floridae]
MGGAGQRFTREILTGSDVILPCDDGAGNPTTLAWSVNIDGNRRTLLLVANGVLNQLSPPVTYAGRLQLDGTKDLHLRDVTITDEGEYRCNAYPYRRYAITLVSLKVYEPSLTTTEASEGLWDVTSSISFVITGNRVTYDIRCDVTGPGPITNQSVAVVLTSGPDRSAQLSTGASVGVALGVIAAIAVIATLVFLLVRNGVVGKGFGDTRSFEGGFVNFRMSFSRHHKDKSDLSRSDVQPSAPPSDPSPNRKQQSQEARTNSLQKPRPHYRPPETDPSMFTSTPRDQSYENYIKWSPSFVLYSKESSVQV